MTPITYMSRVLFRKSRSRLSSNGPMIFDIALSGNRYLRPGENYQFSLKINHLILNYVHVTESDTIQILLKDYSNFGEDLFFEIPINRTVPCEIPGSLKLPAKIASWYAMIIVYGTDQYGYPQQLPFLWVSPLYPLATTQFMMQD